MKNNLLRTYSVSNQYANNHEVLFIPVNLKNHDNSLWTGRTNKRRTHEV